MQKVHAALPDAVRQLMSKVRRKLATALDNRGLSLTPQEAHIVYLIHNRPGISPHEIAESTGHDKAVVTRKIKAMEDMGVLTREKNTEDQRRLHLYLTDCGTGISRQIAAARQEAHGEVFQRLSQTEQRQLAALLEKCL